MNLKMIQNKFFILGVLLMSLVSCNENKIVFIDNTFLNGNNNILPDEFFKKEENDYYIYYYSLYCPPCNDLKDNIDDFIRRSEIKVYTLSRQNFEDTSIFKEKDETLTNEEMKNEMIGTNTISEVYLIGTPSLLLISSNDQGHYLKDLTLGFKAISEYISDK